MTSSRYKLDHRTLADLVTFARIMVDSRDVEPWADIIRELYTHGDLSREDSIWLLTLYNTYDDLHSAWHHYRRWPTPEAWDNDPDKADAGTFNCTQERRNLRGGRSLKRHQSYMDHLFLLGSGDQESWMRESLVGDSPGADFARLTEHMRKVWGVGRQSAFEWAEFMQKVVDFPADAADGQLWESSGPRRSLERIYGEQSPTPEWLDAVAEECKGHLESEGVPMEWVDFETIICDFHVMREGRYYPGRHLAAISDEILTLPDEEDRKLLQAAYNRFVPEEWQDMPPGGIDKGLLRVYRETGLILDHPTTSNVGSLI